ncbi:hypothetical protein DPMN_158232 [Dreissena polymorpha]|uniref:Uncharacterized protein n=1 Tax=Dreissena polymorpha TaxID=45954 RepID=A0A9D4EHH5_DREPO|nr:hypothetical protein DPMN_158232 [Dreissena polymorpha]
MVTYGNLKRPIVPVTLPMKCDAPMIDTRIEQALRQNTLDVIMTTINHASTLPAGKQCTGLMYEINGGSPELLIRQSSQLPMDPRL